MAVNLPVAEKLHPVPGVLLGTTNAGIKQTQRPDITLFALVEGSRCAGVFTRNAFCAAPVALARKHLANNSPRYLLINSGNANAGTGQAGYEAAQQCCADVAALSQTGLGAEVVLPFSTGVIGQALPVAKIQAALPAAFADLKDSNWANAARAIMTTDTLPKAASKRIEIDGHTVTITGISKGAGMIRPDMATMLAYIATDAAIEQSLLQNCLSQAVNRSFNRITIDGDTSTNDACILIATGQSSLPEITDANSPALAELQAALDEIFITLAQAIVRDGEGASKFISIQVTEGVDEIECLQVAYTIAHSPLVKTAFFASDANWGRILAAVGRAGLPALNVDIIDIHLLNLLDPAQSVCIVRRGGAAEDYTEAAGAAIMEQAEIGIHVSLGRGKTSAEIWTCDLSHDYVRINAEYRT